MEKEIDADVVIAGASLAGVLTAIRLKSEASHLKVVILEKDQHVGGRQTCLNGPNLSRPESFGYGLNYISQPLERYWLQCLQDVLSGQSQKEMSNSTEFSMDPLKIFVGGKHLSQIGLLVGSKMSSLPLKEILTEKIAKAFGGPAAERDWKHVLKLLEQFDERLGTSSVNSVDNSPDEVPGEIQIERQGQAEKSAKNQSVAHFWHQPRKSPGAVVLEQIGLSLGIFDLWNAAPHALTRRAERLLASPIGGPISQWLMESLQVSSLFESLKLGSMILEAKYGDGLWEIKSPNQKVRAPKLIVAQSPWNALNWLPKALWPTSVLHVALKTKPVSLVVLSEKIIQRPVSMPDFLFIPAEKTQAMILPAGQENWEICFQATIDYEMSMQAPSVIKAVKALKRARKKLLALFPGSVSEFNHIALQPDAWATSPMSVDLKWLYGLGKKTMSDPHLLFVGDAYGSSHNTDANIISSVNQAVSSLVRTSDLGVSARRDTPLQETLRLEVQQNL